MIITIMVLIPYELRHFSKVCACIYTEALSFFYLGRGVGCGDVSYLSSTYILVYADNKGSKETVRLCHDKALPADICSIVFMKKINLFLMFFILY